MIELLMVFVGGLLGSSHCVGMCGGFVMALGSTSRGSLHNLARQVMYGTGRVFTYTVGGIAAGYGGWRISQEFRPVGNLQAILSISAGVLLIVQGLLAAGFFQRLTVWKGHHGCLGAGMFGALLRETRLRHVFLAGMVNGLLPCGLVYAYLALAASSGGLWKGGLIMACFGLGTLPVLTLVGWSGYTLSTVARWRVLRLAAWCVVLAGVMSLTRGIGALRT